LLCARHGDQIKDEIASHDKRHTGQCPHHMLHLLSEKIMLCLAAFTAAAGLRVFRQGYWNLSRV
jgi:hypothetical protein